MADWSSILQGILGGARDIASIAGPWYAAERASDNMQSQAGKYRELGQQAASMASPVSNERRGQWDQRLSQLYEDPQGFLEGNPEYKANLSLGTGELAAQNAARGHNLGGKATTDQLKFLTELSSKYIGKERDDLMNMAGYQFDPANSARYLMEGGKLSQEAEIAALAARLAPLGMLGRGNPGGGPSGSDGGGGSPFDLLQRLLGGSGGKNPSGITPANASSLLRMLGSGASSLSGLWSDFNGSLVGLDETNGGVGQGDWTSWFSGYGSDFSDANNFGIGDNDTDWGSIFGNDNFASDWFGDAGFDIRDWGG